MFEERKSELESMVKEIIVDIYMLKIQKDSITKTLESKEAQLKNIGAVLQEFENLSKKVTD